MTADGFPERGLRAHIDGFEKILHFQDRLLRVPHQPENDGIDVHRNRVASQRGFRRHVGHAHALVYERAERLNERNNVKDPWPAQADVTAQP